MFSDPEKIVGQLSLLPGQRVADIGAGSGAYAISLAKAVGHQGRVYAVDIQKDLLSKIKNSALAAGVGNIEIIWGDAEKPSGTGIHDSAMDFVIVANIIFQVQNKEAFAAETARITKPGGTIVVVDWTDSFGGLGPHPSVIFSESTALELYKKYGFEKSKDLSAGAHHYGIVLKKHGKS